MARLSDQLADFVSRVELLARGAEGHRALGERALAAGRPWEAREHALAILEEMPRSRLGLLLWADAAEATLLDHEALEALERLGRELPFRADVWYRLAQARARSGQAVEEDLFRAAELSEPAPAADAARLWLSDLDRAKGDAERAERWLAQLSLVGRASEAARWRRLELLLDAGDAETAATLATSLGEPPLLDARGWLTRARLGSGRFDAAASRAWTRAALLDAPGLVPALANAVARSDDESERALLAALADDVGLGKDPLLRAAFATRAGAREEALAALGEAAERGGPLERERLLARALEERDAPRLRQAAALLGEVPGPVARLLAALDTTDDASRLDALDGAGPEAWADALRREVFARWLPAEGPARFAELSAELGRHAKTLGELEAWAEIAQVSRDLERPLRVAIVGEFNAGKSSLINALLGEAVAPVGVLPTTATQNHLVWAPDRFARIERSDGGPDRVVPHAELRRALGEIPAEHVQRVSIYAPLELLRKLELTDTPGFNAPDSTHAASARSAFRDAHVALWLLDATQPLKDSERAVLQEIRALGLPLLVLLNKLDRLAGEGELAQALAHVQAGLLASGVATEAPPLAFSARLALAGKAGDAEALASSRFAEIEALVDRVLVGRSELVKRRSLERRCREISERLLASAEGVERERAEGARREQELRQRLERATGSLGAERERLATRLEGECERALSAFVDDTRRVASILEDPGARRFVRGRARVLLAGRLVEALVAALELDHERVRRRLGPRVEALSAASVVPLLGEGDPTGPRRDLAAALLEEAAAALAELADELAPAAAPPLGARLRSLCDALAERGRGFL